MVFSSTSESRVMFWALRVPKGTEHLGSCPECVFHHGDRPHTVWWRPEFHLCHAQCDCKGLPNSSVRWHSASVTERGVTMLDYNRQDQEALGYCDTGWWLQTGHCTFQKATQKDCEGFHHKQMTNVEKTSMSPWLKHYSLYQNITWSPTHYKKRVVINIGNIKICYCNISILKNSNYNSYHHYNNYFMSTGE
jgi:hypothetical protein